MIMAGAAEETPGAGQQQIAVGDPLKLTKQCQQIGGGGEEEASPWRERPSAAARKKKDKCKGNEEVREAGGEARGFGISMPCQQLEKEKWTGNETKVLNGEELRDLSGGRYSEVIHRVNTREKRQKVKVMQGMQWREGGKREGEGLRKDGRKLERVIFFPGELLSELEMCVCACVRKRNSSGSPATQRFPKPSA